MYPGTGPCDVGHIESCLWSLISYCGREYKGAAKGYKLPWERAAKTAGNVEKRQGFGSVPTIGHDAGRWDWTWQNCPLFRGSGGLEVHHRSISSS